MSSSWGIWLRVVRMWTGVSEEHITHICNVKNQLSKKLCLATCWELVLARLIFGLENGSISSSETSVHIRTKRRYVPEDVYIYYYCREYLIFYTALYKNNVDLWDVRPCVSCKMAIIGELGTLALTCNRHMLRRNTIVFQIVFLFSVHRLLLIAYVAPTWPILVHLMMEALHYFETSVLTRVTWRNIPKYGIVHSRRREYLKSYTALTGRSL
jgi:hypothetical protein